MKSRSLLFFSSLLIIATSAMAGEDPGIRDSVELVVAVQPNDTNGQFDVQVEMYVVNDSSILGATAGFFWDNPNLLLDSAKPSALISAGFDGGTFFYRNGNLDTSNFYREFTLGGYTLSGKGVPPTTQRRLWATYFFTLSTWSATDSIVIDTALIPPASYLFFTVPDTNATHGSQSSFIPEWKGAIVIKDASDVLVTDSPELPHMFSLGQNYPNPFNPSTQISFEVPIGSHVTLSVYNLIGQRVTTLVDEELSPNHYVVEWDGTADGEAKVASGIYFYRLEARDFIETKKMMLLK